MTTLPPVDFVVIDVETACSRVSSICQIGIVGFANGVEAFAWETMVDPCDEFSPFNTRIHGITSDHVRGKPSFAEVHATVRDYLTGNVTVAHSMFDKGALAAACLVHALPPVETRWLDSVGVARRTWPELPSHRLNVLAKFLKLRHRHHDALSDARAAGMVVVQAMAHAGSDLATLMKPVPPRRRAAPEVAVTGVLQGERIAILGEPRDGPLAWRLAAQGARIMATVGQTSTMLVVSNAQPFGSFVHAQAEYRRAVELGTTIMTENELLARLSG